MLRKPYFVLTILLTVFPSIATAQKTAAVRLTAPTFYIAASAELRDTDHIYVRGASNLPAGARLGINISDFVGEGSSTLNQEIDVAIGKDGFFEATISPKPSVKFR